VSDSLHIVCPHCSGVNRVPSAKLKSNGSCGKCHKQLVTGAPLELTSQNFQRHITKNDLPVVVDFWASWCGPCKMMAPVFSQAAEQLQSQYILAKVNTEQHQQVAAQYSIQSIPTLAIFKHGKEIARQAGAMQLPQLVSWIKQFK
jgi:thioredoxin 2